LNKDLRKALADDANHSHARAPRGLEQLLANASCGGGRIQFHARPAGSGQRVCGPQLAAVQMGSCDSFSI